MSHTNSIIELSEGLNVLTGPNNSGKSAIISALQLLAELPVKEGDYMVKHGTQETEVTVQTSEGDELTWQRTGGSSIALTINGERCVRLNNDRDHYLKKLHKSLKLPKVVGKEIKEPFDIHFGTQKDPIFLINKPASHAASFFASSSDAGRLVEIRDKYKDLVKSKKFDRKNINSNLENQKKILLVLDPLMEMENRVLLIKEIYKKFPQEEQAITQVATSVQEIKRGQDVRQKHLIRCQRLQMLQIPPKMEDAHSLAMHIEAMATEINKVERETATVKALESLPTIPKLLPAATLDADFSALKRISKHAASLQRTNDTFALMEKPPEMEHTESVNNALTSIKEQEIIIEKNKAVTSQIGLMQPMPIFADISSIRVCSEDLSSCTTKKQKAARRFSELNKLSEPPHYRDSAELAKQCSLLQARVKIEAQSRSAVEALSTLEQPPIIHNPMSLQQSFEQLRNRKNHFFKLSQHSIHIEKLQPPPPLVTTDQLGLFVKDYVIFTQSVKKIVKNLQEVESALEAYLAINPACPLCGGDFNPLQEKACHG
jgi:exonuclease SbcC